MSFALGRRRLLQLLGLSPAAALPARAAAVPAPTRAPVRVLFTRVNGERYYDAPAVLDLLTEDEPVLLRREPTNPHDRRAIEVLTIEGRKLGYVARVDNNAVARMMDAGDRFRGRLVRIDADTLDLRLVVGWLPGAQDGRHDRA